LIKHYFFFLHRFSLLKSEDFSSFEKSGKRNATNPDRRCFFGFYCTKVKVKLESLVSVSNSNQNQAFSFPVQAYLPQFTLLSFSFLKTFLWMELPQATSSPFLDLLHLKKESCFGFAMETDDLSSSSK